MRKTFSWGAALAAVTLSTLVASPANAILGGTAASEVGPNVVLAGGGCSGTLISPRWVISADHCFEATGTSGTIEWGNTMREQGQQASYSRVESEGDVSLVRLDTELPANAVKFPQLADADPQIGDTVKFFGFGTDDSGQLSRVLRTGSAKVSSVSDRDDEGAPAWSTTRSGDSNVAGGDSGGGAYLDGKLAGVTSQAGGTDISIFASIAAHRKFIDKTIKG